MLAPASAHAGGLNSSDEGPSCAFFNPTCPTHGLFLHKPLKAPMLTHTHPHLKPFTPPLPPWIFPCPPHGLFLHKPFRTPTPTHTLPHLEPSTPRILTSLNPPSPP